MLKQLHIAICYKEVIAESDKVFYHERLLAKFIEIPEIEIDTNGQ